MDDGELSDSQSFDVIVNPVNDIPYFTTNLSQDFVDEDLEYILDFNNFVEDIDKAGPFGPDSPRPIFVLKNCKIKWCKLLNNKHLKFYIYDESYRKIQSIFFRALDNKAGIFLYENIESTYHFAGNIEINDWLGKKVPNFVVKDIALANS